MTALSIDAAQPGSTTGLSLNGLVAYAVPGLASSFLFTAVSLYLLKPRK